MTSPNLIFQVALMTLGTFYVVALVVRSQPDKIHSSSSNEAPGKSSGERKITTPAASGYSVCGQPGVICGSTVWQEPPFCMSDRTCVLAACTYRGQVGAAVPYTEPDITGLERGVFFKVNQLVKMNFSNGALISMAAEISDDAVFQYVAARCKASSTLVCEGDSLATGDSYTAFVTSMCNATTAAKCDVSDLSITNEYTLRQCNETSLPTSTATAVYEDEDGGRAQLLVKAQGADADRFYARGMIVRNASYFHAYLYYNDAPDVDMPLSYADLNAVVQKLWSERNPLYDF